jgi:hydrogenase maturation protein HypF
MTASISAITIHVNGIVQGVGFRPFVYQLAREMGLGGRVANTAAGVTIHAEGPAGQLDRFIETLQARKPVLAHIVSIDTRTAEAVGYRQFEIAKSQGAHSRATLISPDVCMCADCRAELFDANDRRFGYPFINCTNCGPRYTIIDDIPYDRPKTSMRHFTMCHRCQAEYDDPADRRFHAQPNACPQCGPSVSLFDPRRKPLAAADAIARTADRLKAGEIVAIKGLGGYHLAVDATNDAAVARLRTRKQREEKPLAVMSADLTAIEAYARIKPPEAQLLASIQRPIVLLEKKLPEKLAFSVSPRNRYYGVMLPYTPLHELLLAHGFVALVMTSGNVSQKPIAIDNDEAFQRLGQIADCFLIHDRQIYLRSDDSIVRYAAGKPRPIRRSRGFVPMPVFLKSAVPRVLACGGELKNTICLTKERQAFVSQHIGDLENLATERFFRMTIEHLQRILDITPEIIACDHHPDYLSTQWAYAQLGNSTIPVQHHHAHVAACMAEHQLDDPVIGLAFDGSGLGADSTVWGGEVLVADYRGYRRAAHLTAIPMPGAAAAVKAPWRMALSHLDHALGASLWDLDLPLMRRLDRARARTVVQMCARGINAPLTSSMGRLFDAVAALLGLRLDTAFEGQAAMELEMIADPGHDERYDFTWNDAEPKQVAVAPMVAGVVEDVQRGLPAFIISAKFHNTLIHGFSMLCRDLRKVNRINRVVLSGGCFQNTLLLEGLKNHLTADRFDVFCHRLVPANDGGIALGQAVIAAATASGQQTKVEI